MKFWLPQPKHLFFINKLNDTKIIQILTHLCATLTVHSTAPFDKLVPMLIFIKATTPLVEHHAVVLVMFKPHSSLLCPSTQSLLNCSFGEWCFQSSLFETSLSSLFNGVTVEKVAAKHLTNPNCYRLIVLSVESSPRVTINVHAAPPAGW